MRSARLNIFQKTQRLWDTIHPYNAAQLAELSLPLPVEQINDAFRRAFDDLRLGAFVSVGRSYVVESAQAPTCIATTEPLDALLSREMNTAFDRHRSVPFRPFVQHDGERQTIGLVYQHWVADSVSIRLLMLAWVKRLVGPSCLPPLEGGIKGGVLERDVAARSSIPPTPPFPSRGEGARAIALPAGGMWHYFSGPAVGWSVIAQLSGLLGFAARMKRMRRVETVPVHRNIAVTVRTLPAGIIQSIRVKARTLGATVGDVFIAAATEAVAKHGPNVATKRRPGLAMGSIVDARARSKAVPANVFGLFLGFTMTTFGERDAVDFDHLLRRAAQQRRSDLRHHAAEASQLNMAIGYAIARTKKTKSLLEFYRKRFPLAGGLSSVNMGPEWTVQLHPKSIGLYHRVSPTGPLMPIVLTPTTLGDRLSLCCTYQAGIVSDANAEAVISSFINRVADFAKVAADERR